MDTENTNDDKAMPLASAGSHGSASRWNGVPVAWAAVGQNGVPLWLAYHRQDAQGAVVGMAQVVPLYRSPALPDEEREAIEECVNFAFPASHPTATTLRNLLQRTK
jgi:hypothetical protein